MRGDFDRVTFDPTDCFANVLLQQGRLLLAADFNEQSAIYHHFLRTLIVDIYGSRWRPYDGFVTKVTDGTLNISKGRFYVDGIQCENSDNCTFGEQPFAPTPETPAMLEKFKEALSNTQIFFYLDCWERHVTWLNYPRLRDTALGGPDTATRLQIAWQVRPLTVGLIVEQLENVLKALNNRTGESGDQLVATKIADSKTILDAAHSKNLDFDQVNLLLELFAMAPPRLSAETRRGADQPDPCAIAPDARYRGRENQLYRVEIHRPGLPQDEGATFKWSRESGSVAFKVLDVTHDLKNKSVCVHLESLGHDRRTGLCEGDWVELSDTDAELQQWAWPLQQIKKIDRQRRLVTLEYLKGSPEINLERQPILRRWDHCEHPDNPLSDGAIPVIEGERIELERGIGIHFEKGGLYCAGQYWLITARVTDGIEWPMKAGHPVACEPHGVHHHRAVVAIIERNANNKGWTEKAEKTVQKKKPS
jgi:hypothetical protein